MDAARPRASQYGAGEMERRIACGACSGLSTQAHKSSIDQLSALYDDQYSKMSIGALIAATMIGTASLNTSSTLILKTEELANMDFWGKDTFKKIRAACGREGLAWLSFLAFQ